MKTFREIEIEGIRAARKVEVDSLKGILKFERIMIGIMLSGIVTLLAALSLID